MSKMEIREYRIRFTTPAFLGNAEQQAQWRTPPFKALLRQWWRVAVAKRYAYDHKRIREAEGKVMGHAWLENDTDINGNKVSARRSQIQLRMTPWDTGRLKPADWPKNGFENVVTTRDGRGRVRSDVYLGFGPVSHKTKSSISEVISVNEEATLRVRFPSNYVSDLEQTIQLISWFGANGSRSRNGWGSIDMAEVGLDELKSDGLGSISRNLESCLHEDWPHAIGFDDRGMLIWLSQPVSDWRKAMSILAHEKANIRRAAKEFTGPDNIGGIHLLGYPAGKAWELRELSKDARLASQIRFKVINTTDGLCSMIFQLPARFPDELLGRLNNGQRHWIKENELEVMRTIHRYLDDASKLSRLK